MRGLAAVVLLTVAATACSGNDDDAADAAAVSTPATAATTPATSAASTEVSAEEQYPDIVAVDAEFDDDNGTWSFAVTVSSPYDSPERYADGWRVLGPDDRVYGVHTLGHDHANEQPFTRRQIGVDVPDGVEAVTIEGRDQVSGFGGQTVTVELEASDR